MLAAYARDLAVVQAHYERHKMRPPLPRNAPRVAGHILWARQLLRRVDAPMKRSAHPCRGAMLLQAFSHASQLQCIKKWTCPRRFAAHKALLAAKDSKRVVHQYNKLATILIKFEVLWHAAWLKRVEQSHFPLQSALIVRHPQFGAPPRSCCGKCALTGRLPCGK